MIQKVKGIFKTDGGYISSYDFIPWLKKQGVDAIFPAYGGKYKVSLAVKIGKRRKLFKAVVAVDCITCECCGPATTITWLRSADYNAGVNRVPQRIS